MNNNKFDELTKGMAQSVTRRQALKKFGVGVVGMALGCFGLANAARAHKDKSCTPSGFGCSSGKECCSRNCECFTNQIGVVTYCVCA